MLTTPKEKRKNEVAQATVPSVVEENEDASTRDAVEQVVGTMFQNVEAIINNEEGTSEIERNVQKIGVTEIKLEKENIATENAVNKMTQKETMEMIKQLPAARQEEYKAYIGGQKNKTKQRKSSKKYRNK